MWTGQPLLPDFSLVGTLKTGSDSVQCHTDLTTCCSGGQGIHRGDWYFPNGDRLPFSPAAIHESRGKKRVDLRRWSATSPTGMYYCDIATVDVHDNETTHLTRKRVYVGLYTNGGGLQKSYIYYNIFVNLHHRRCVTIRWCYT